MNFKQELNNILLEGNKRISSNEIIDAINNKYRVIINYDDEKENAPTGNRLIEPYVLGLSSANNEVLRAYQYYGSTRRGVPKYKLFRIDRILNWQPQPNNHFYADPKKLAVVAPDYNEDGDGSMTQIFAQVKFGGDNNVRQTNNTSDEWESPLDRVKREKEAQKQSIEQQINNKPKNVGAIKTKGLEDELNQNKSDFSQNLDNNLGLDGVNNNNRGAIKINPNIYDRDNKTQQQKRNNDIMRKRDNRWQNAANSRPLYKKNSLNNELRQELNNALNINDADEEEIKNNENI